MKTKKENKLEQTDLTSISVVAQRRFPPEPLDVGYAVKKTNLRDIASSVGLAEMFSARVMENKNHCHNTGRCPGCGQAGYMCSYCPGCNPRRIAKS